MRRCLVLFCLIMLSVQAAGAQQGSPGLDWLANAQLHVIALPDQLKADSTPTNLGDLRMVLDADHGQLLYQYDEKPIQSIQLPAALQKEYATNRITIAPDRAAATICHIENNNTGFTGTEFIVDLQNHQIAQGDPCLMDDWWYPAQADLWYRQTCSIAYLCRMAILYASTLWGELLLLSRRIVGVLERATMINHQMLEETRALCVGWMTTDS